MKTDAKFGTEPVFLDESSSTESEESWQAARKQRPLITRSRQKSFYKTRRERNNEGWKGRGSRFCLTRKSTLALLRYSGVIVWFLGLLAVVYMLHMKVELLEERLKDCQCGDIEQTLRYLEANMTRLKSIVAGVGI